MASIEYEGKVTEVPDGDELQETCEDMGVPFACTSGICGTCMIDIVEGEDNLTELTEMETDLGMDKTQRLACQCKIKSGNVKIRF